MTLVGRICEKFTEAGWLVALVLVPVFLNPFSDQVFEPDKAALLRLLAVLMLAAWVVRSLDSSTLSLPPGSPASRLRQVLSRAKDALVKAPIAGPVLLLVLVQVASTITSVSPRQAWWGSYERAQGTYTLFAYVALFFLLITFLRRNDQLQRLISVVVLTSFPVAVYAVLQHYGMSLLQFSEAGIDVRVISTLGNAIFLAAYLAMVMPLALWRLVESIQEWKVDPTRSALAAVLYGTLLALQLAAITFTQSRGPILGLLGELFTFVLLIALLRQRRGLAVAGVLVAALAGTLLIALNIPSLPLDSLRSLPYLERFSRMAGTQGTELQARALAWETTLDAMRAEPARFALGYGPETMKSVLTKFMPAQLWVLQGGGQYGTFDRAHNAVLDALFARGILGVIAYLLLYGWIFYQALRWMGFAPTKRESRILAGLLLSGTLVGLVVPWLLFGELTFVGAGMPAGMLAGMISFLVGKAIFWTGAATNSPSTDQFAENETHSLLMAALLAAVVGHFIESQTGIEIVATLSYFWIYAAVIIVLGTGRLGEAEPALLSVAPPEQRRRFRRGRRGAHRTPSDAAASPDQSLGSIITMALVTAVLLAALSYAFIHGFNVPGARQPAQILILITWFFAGLIILTEHGGSGADAPSVSGDVLTYAIVSLGWPLPFAMYHRVNAQTLDHLNVSYLVFVAWLFVTLVGIAVALRWNELPPHSVVNSNRVVLYPVIALLALSIVWRADVQRIQADIHEKVGKTAMSAGLWSQAIPHLQQAVALEPGQDQYYIHLGGAYVEQARIAADPSTRAMWIDQARHTFERGQALAPRNSDHPRQLGLMYGVWADWANDGATRRQRLQRSLDYHLAAVALNPENPDLRLDVARAYFRLGMNEQAFAEYQHAVDIGSPDHLGRAYAGLADVYLARGDIEAAAEAFRQAMQAGRDRQQVLEAHIGAANQEPNDIRARLGLALVYAGADRQADALNELDAALETASSAAERAQVEQVIAMVEK